MNTNKQYLHYFGFVNTDYWELAAQQSRIHLPKEETWVWSQGWEDPLEKEMETLSSILAWEIPWTEGPGGLQSMGSQRVGHDLLPKQQQSRSYDIFFQTYSMSWFLCHLKWNIPTANDKSSLFLHSVSNFCYLITGLEFDIFLLCFPLCLLKNASPPFLKHSNFSRIMSMAQNQRIWDHVLSSEMGLLDDGHSGVSLPVG